MKYLPPFLFTVFLLFQTNSADAQNMNNKLLGEIITEVADSIQGQEGYWQIAYKEITILVITDQNHNRMRMVTPIARLDELDETFYIKALQANFHSALDVKYAISEGIMCTVFIHPLKELSEDQVRDAITQVYFATKTFGTIYSSTDLVFPSRKQTGG